jgi:glycosyltransferase involved in cell wall biosynthesis
MKQPVILQVLPALRAGGVERGTVEIAGAVARAGWKSLVASEGGAMVPGLTFAGGEHLTLPLASKNPLTMWRNMYALEKIIRERQVDIIHARSRAPAWSAYYAAKHTGIPFVTTFHGIYKNSSNLKKRYNSIMTKGERVIAVSHFVAKHISEHYTPYTSRVRTIHRGVDLNVFDPVRILPQRMVNLAAKWRLPDDLPLIIMPARITRWKGQHVLVEALAQLPHRKFFCLLMGDDLGHPEFRRDLERDIIARGLGEHLRVADNTSHMAEAYMLADIVVAPSIEPEAFGRVPVEAQAMGKLVIATNHGGACETVIDGETGWLAIPGDAADLSRIIAHALSLSHLEKNRIGIQAMQHVHAHFSAETMCKKTLDVYWELISSKYEKNTDH